MSLHPHAALAALLIALSLPAAHAQSQAAAPASSASAPSAVYRSALDGYRRFADQPISSWRASNDLVARIGGWQAYAREAAASAPAAPGNHQGHHEHKKP